MNRPINVLVIAIALVHIGFFVLETMLWDAPFVQTSIVARYAPEKLLAILAHNQGVYNGFLAAGLLWGLVTQQKPDWFCFLLVCIAIAGVFGSLSLGRPMAALLQTLPAAIALLLVFFNVRRSQASN